MKHCLIVLILLCFAPAFAQKERQGFCAGDPDASYFTLLEKKKLIWVNTYYFETFEGEVNLNGKAYLKYRQKWENGTINYLYLREDDGRILQYEECCKTETVRYDEFFEPGHTWISEAKDVTYTLLSYNAELKTPYCKYTGLMSVEARYSSVTYTFYYQKGSGFVGATQKDKIIACASPE